MPRSQHRSLLVEALEAKRECRAATDDAGGRRSALVINNTWLYENVTQWIGDPKKAPDLDVVTCLGGQSQVPHQWQGGRGYPSSPDVPCQRLQA
eukprot:6473791-Amphidinium_carterae.1